MYRITIFYISIKGEYQKHIQHKDDCTQKEAEKILSTAVNMFRIKGNTVLKAELSKVIDSIDYTTNLQ